MRQHAPYLKLNHQIVGVTRNQLEGRFPRRRYEAGNSPAARGTHGYAGIQPQQCAHPCRGAVVLAAIPKAMDDACKQAQAGTILEAHPWQLDMCRPRLR